MHISVLLNECIEYLNLAEDSVVVDCTLGYAGHSKEVLKRIKKGFLFAFDQDQEAIKHSRQILQNIASNYEIINSNFENITTELEKRNISNVNGILFDLGVSSPQLDVDTRGFSFHNDAQLDMRMNQNQELTAEIVVNTYEEKDLANIFFTYGDEKYARSIAKNIVKARQEKELKTTLELVEVIKSSVPDKYKREKHPARKVFQALRIEVNNEMNVLENALNQALELIGLNGRICVITFHSLEDRIVKNIFKKATSLNSELKKLPVVPEEYLPRFKLVATTSPSEEEIENNKRARSSKLRVIERIR